ncbi:phosphoglucosamine mutase, partial [Candidatus Woesearchaeota archaeon]|nr:phosphoglucosamine mutase [Candidatus Woesearchaeota archaeon]
LAALQILRIMKESKQPLSKLAECMTSWPQRTEGLLVKEKKPLEKLPKVQNAIKTIEKELGTDGRIFVRYSGTEQKVRIMIEAKDGTHITRWTEQVIDAFKEEGL